MHFHSHVMEALGVDAARRAEVAHGTASFAARRRNRRGPFGVQGWAKGVLGYRLRPTENRAALEDAAAVSLAP